MKYFIWDLDGTLIDSYGVIISSLKEALEENNLFFTTEEIKKEILSKTVSNFLSNLEEKGLINKKKINDRYLEIGLNKIDEIKLISNAKEILEYIISNGGVNFIFTHRGKSAYDILKNNNILDLFKEIITEDRGFLRKPNKEAIDYLIDKYNLSRDEVVYVGDRKIDILCAKNAHIKSILLSSGFIKTVDIEDYNISNLLKIKDLM